MTPQTSYWKLWRHQMAPTISRTIPKPFSQKIMFGNVKLLEHCFCFLFWETRKEVDRQNPTIRLVDSWKSWIWDQYLSKSMKWTSRIFLSHSKELRRLQILYYFQLQESLPLFGILYTMFNLSFAFFEISEIQNLQIRKKRHSKFNDSKMSKLLELIFG